MNEDNVDFDEVLKLVIGRRNFLLNWFFKKIFFGWIWRRKGRRGGSRIEGRILNEKGCFEFVIFIFGLIKKKLKFVSDEVIFII